MSVIGIYVSESPRTTENLVGETLLSLGIASERFPV